MDGAASAGGGRVSVAGTEMDHPPRARLAFRVGIIGHRPNRLPKDQARLALLRQTLHAILRDTRETLQAAANDPVIALYEKGAPILRAVSPLAEGADRIFAEEAMALGYELCCPMPFFQKEFEKDFVPPLTLEKGSAEQFHALLSRARKGAGLTIFEMDGDRAQAPDAYGATGRVVLNQTDLLIAVWDGGEPQGRGGTVYTLHEALRYHVPVIWVDALAPDTWRVLRARADLVGSPGVVSSARSSREQLRDAVAAIVRAEFQLPAHRADEIASHAPDYFAEYKRKLDLGFVWRMFRNFVVDGRVSLPIISADDFAAQLRREWSTPADGQPRPSHLADWIDRRLRNHFGWADGLANYYADAHRSAFVASYFLLATAVFVALLPMAVGWSDRREILCAFAEIAILLSNLLLLNWARSHHWHERWTDYRLLAELIRQLCFLVPLGGGRPLPRIPAHLAVYGDPARTWMYWHVRAIAREIGIPDARVAPEYMRECLDFLASLVGDEHGGQHAFHLASERRSRLLSKRLRASVYILFGATIAAVVIRLPLLLSGHGEPPLAAVFGRWLLLASATLPAFGAALEGINNQGEFTRIAKRSAAMASGFGQYAARIALLKKGPLPPLSDVIPLSSNIAEAMVAEVVDWRAVFIDRPQ